MPYCGGGWKDFSFINISSIIDHLHILVLKTKLSGEILHNTNRIERERPIWNLRELAFGDQALDIGRDGFGGSG